MKIEAALTAKALESYSLCPMRYRLYRLGGPGHGRAHRLDAPRTLHAAMRRSLGECYRMGGPRHFPVDRLLETFTGCFDGSASADSREEEEYRATGRRLLAEYHADHVGDDPSRVEVDVRLEHQVEGYPFEARADRRERPEDGRVTLVLYTTARRPPGPGALREDLQTGLLQLLAGQAGKQEVSVEVHALRQRKTLEATKPPEVMEHLARRIVALAGAMTTATDYPAIRAPHCRWCHSRGVCPEWTRR